MASAIRVSPENWTWRERFLALRLAGLEQDAPRSGRLPRIPERKVRAVVEATRHTTPPATTHWSTRRMATAQGLSEATVRRIWKRHHLTPPLSRTFKLSRDQHLVETLYEVVGQRDALQLHLQIPALRAEDLLESVNKRRKALNLPEIAELTTDTKLNAGLLDTAKTPEFNKESNSSRSKGAVRRREGISRSRKNGGGRNRCRSHNTGG